MAEKNSNSKICCKSCTDDIYAHSRVAVRCVECKDFELCPECFASKVDLGQHSPNHAYKLIDNGGFQIFNTAWSASEHLKLLNAIEQYGYGNWEDIARGINTQSDNNPVYKQRSPSEIKDEYCNIFLDSSLGRHTWKEGDRGTTKDHTSPVASPKNCSEVAANITTNESIMLGYMPKRDDFEVEFDNECESMVSQLEDDFVNSLGSSEDDELIMSLNVAHVEAYKAKLRERERRKRISREHALISDFFKENPLFGEKKTSSSGSSSGKTKKSLVKDPTQERIKILSEFQNPKDHQAFIVGTTREKELKARIKDIMRFRKNGITKISDSVEFEVQRLRRNNKKKNEKRRLQQNVILGEAAADMNVQLAQSPMSIKSEDFSTAGSAVQSPMPTAPSPMPKSEDGLQISLLPGYEMLSANERKLCSNLRLTPAHYISYKTCLLTNHLQKKKGQTPKPLNPVGLDKNNRKIIFNFLMRAGWITAY